MPRRGSEFQGQACMQRRKQPRFLSVRADAPRMEVRALRRQRERERAAPSAAAAAESDSRPRARRPSGIEDCEGLVGLRDPCAPERAMLRWATAMIATKLAPMVRGYAQHEKSGTLARVRCMQRTALAELRPVVLRCFLVHSLNAQFNA